MGNFLMALIPLLTGITQPLKDWFDYKKQAAKQEQDYKLAVLQSQTERAKQQMISDTTDLGNRLNATTQEFKQGTFYPLWAVVIFSVAFPKRAAEMWNNFSLIPDWFQWLFLSVYSAIWGLPIIRGGYGAITELLNSRRDFKINKTNLENQATVEIFKNISINEKVLADEIRKSLFSKNGMTQSQWDSILTSVKKSLDK